MAEDPIILDCTIRDGSYAIDFKFTARDTALVAGLLDDAGVQLIEIGHGLGLGASEAGKGRAASTDAEAIAAARERVSRGRIGAFYIPDIGGPDDLRAARDAGLDFVRVGQNADEIATAYPDVELARELGFEVYLNLMKTYGLAPEDFGRVAAEAEAIGAAGIYVVDSAGGMLPAEVAAYVTAARAVSAIPVGFHGHSNLHLAVANSVAAWQAGATYVDTSVYGIGRSSGNVPTEVMAAVFQRMGVDCGIDPLAIVDIAETYLRPLAEHLHPHTMTAVALGLGRFHSAFLPRAQAAAAEAGISPYELIVELGRQDVMRMPPEMLDATVARLAGHSRSPQTRLDLARFSDERFSRDRIGNRPQALAELVDGLEVVAAKRGLAVVLDLVVTPALEDEELVAEFVVEDDDMALGRVRGGALDVVLDTVVRHGRRADLIALDLEPVAPADAPRVLRAATEALGERVVGYRSGALLAELLIEAATGLLAARGLEAARVHDPGLLRPDDVDRIRRELPAGEGGLLVVAGPVTDPAGLPADAVGFADRLHGAEGAPAGAVLLAPEDAYQGALRRWRRALAAATRHDLPRALS